MRNRFAPPLGTILLGSVASLSLALAASYADDGVERLRPTVSSSTHHDTSPPLRVVIGAARSGNSSAPMYSSGIFLPDGGVGSVVANFEGVPSVDGAAFADASGDAGPSHYVQWVNRSFRVFDKTGTPLTPILPGNTLWLGFGGDCEIETDELTPNVLYDHLADRWLATRAAHGAVGNYQCMAVSQTPDPLGAWHRYAFLIGLVVPPGTLEDSHGVPRFGLWPDGYYMSAQLLRSDDILTFFSGRIVAAFERSAMLQGLPARMVDFRVGVPSNMVNTYRGILPSDLDGPPPPAGSPNYFAQLGTIGTTVFNTMQFYRFRVDWNTPANSTFGNNGSSEFNLLVAPFEPSCIQCVPQPDIPVLLWAGGAAGFAGGRRLHYRLQYRNFGTHEALLASHEVNAATPPAHRLAPRWYMVRRDPGGVPFVAEQGTFGPDDGVHRWMGSAAMDADGNIAVGHNASSAAVYPSIRFTGRLAMDPPGQMPYGEGVLISGTGSMTEPGGSWGSFSTMSVDPDGCTFWYTGEYMAATGTEWRTRIGAGKFNSCVPAQPAP